MPKAKPADPAATFATRLESELAALGLSGRECSRRAGLPDNAVGDILRGGNENPSLRAVAAILRAIGRPWAWLDGA